MKTKHLISGIAAVTFTSFAGLAVYHSVMPEKTNFFQADKHTNSTELDKLLKKANNKAHAAVNKRITELSQFISSRKDGAEPFSEEMVSFYGKWRTVKPFLPFTDDDSHKDYIHDEFSRHIFSKEELSNAVKRCIEGCILDLQEIENELAVAVRSEILGRSLAPGEIPVVEKQFRGTMQKMLESSQWSATKGAGSLVASEVAEAIGAQVLVRMGISAGILGAGAANSWWSFGASAIIGLGVDLVWNWIDDPAGDIEEEMKKSLDKLNVKSCTAIRAELIQLINNRCHLWQEVIEKGA